MKKLKFKLLMSLALLLLLMPSVCYAKPKYTGNTVLSKGTVETEGIYSSVKGGENALLVTGGSNIVDSCTVTKSGDEDSEDSDFYGTNAGVLVYNGASLDMQMGTVTTEGSHANGVFAYENGIITMNGVTINTYGNNSGGIMVAGGGSITANELNVKTTGNSSAAIRSDRGGGTISVSGGTYETSGVGSPAIYSTAEIIVDNAKLISTSSEGVVVEGANSVVLNNVTLVDTNKTLNGQSETYKNIFLYQSMSGDANLGTAYFNASDCTIETNKGDTIFVTNTRASITLVNNTITNKDGDFLRIQTGKWGKEGSNGGDVILTLVNQKVEGNIIVDSISKLDMSLGNKSVLKGSINSKNESQDIILILSADSVFELTGDSYVTTLNNADTENSNIHLNGHKLYVDGVEVTGNDSSTKDVNNEVKSNNKTIYIIIGAIVVVGALAGTVITMKRKNLA